MSDIDARLREIAEEGSCQRQDDPVLKSAADEITRLRAELAAAKARIAELERGNHWRLEDKLAAAARRCALPSPGTDTSLTAKDVPEGFLD